MNKENIIQNFIKNLQLNNNSKAIKKNYKEDDDENRKGGLFICPLNEKSIDNLKLNHAFELL